MKEFFTIKTGVPFYDQDFEEKIMYSERQRVCLGLMLAGAVLLLYSILG